jgi:putative peptidoglycan lipid II flippase
MFRSHTYFSYRVLNSALQAWTQVTIGLLGVATAILLNTLWAEKLGLRGIALSTTLSSLQSAILASICVRRLLGARPSGEQRRGLMRIFASIAVLGIVACAGLYLVPGTLQARSNTLWAIAAGATVIPAALLAFALAWKLKIPEVGSLLALASRLTRRIPIGANSKNY